MEATSPQVSSPGLGSFSAPSSRSRSSTKLTVDDLTSLTSFNPFSEEDENDRAGFFEDVTSLFSWSRMKNTLSAPLASVTAASSNTAQNTSATPANATTTAEARRPSYNLTHTSSNMSSRSNSERPNSLTLGHAMNPAPPVVSLTPAHLRAPDIQR